MIKMQLFRTVLISGMVVALIPSCSSLPSFAPQPKQESAGQFIDGSVITAKVKTKLLGDKYLRGSSIKVNTYKNTVQLSGFANTESQRQRAGMLAQEVEGVAAVHNSILVKRR